MKKEINLKYLGEIDRVHAMSTGIFEKVSKLLKGFDKDNSLKNKRELLNKLNEKHSNADYSKSSSLKK